MNSADTAKGRTVLHIAPTPFFSDRGCHMRIRGMIESLREKGIDAILCTYHLGRDIPGIPTVRTPPIPGYTRQEAGPTPFKYLADLLLVWKVLKTVARQRPDLLHGHLHEGVLIGAFARIFFFWRAIPLVGDFQGSLTGELDGHGFFEKRPALRRIFRGIEFLINRLPRQITCSSTACREVLVRDFRIPESKVTLVEDGFQAAGDSTPEERLRLREKLALPQDRPLVVYSGGLLAAKGLDVLCGSLLEARNRGLRCHFLLIGYPEEETRNFLLRHGLEGICTLTGRVPIDQLGSYLALAEVALEPKPAGGGEASGKLLNYMGAGLPVVCFDTGNNRRFLGDSGYFARPGSLGSFVDQLAAALERPEEAAARGDAGRRRVREEFTWQQAADRIGPIYSALLRGAPKPYQAGATR